MSWASADRCGSGVRDALTWLSRGSSATTTATIELRVCRPPIAANHRRQLAWYGLRPVPRSSIMTTVNVRTVTRSLISTSERDSSATLSNCWVNLARIACCFRRDQIVADGCHAGSPRPFIISMYFWNPRLQQQTRLGAQHSAFSPKIEIFMFQKNLGCDEPKGNQTSRISNFQN